MDPREIARKIMNEGWEELGIQDPQIMDLIEAHKHCFANKKETLNSNLCGCFYCSMMFPPYEIKFFDPSGPHPQTRQPRDDTAICPYCGIDSVIGDASGYEITEEFLDKMHDHWFKDHETHGKN